MKKSLYKVAQMDCAAEENLVRMKLDPLPSVRALDFDLAQRSVTVYHDGDADEIGDAIAALALGAQHVHTTEADEAAPERSVQRNLLWTVLLINFAFFALEATAGLVSGSMGLVADSLDMLADALVYAMSLLVVGSTVLRKKAVAKWSGYFQLSLAVIGLVEVVRRFLGVEALPDFGTMIVVSILALIANAVCLYVLQRSKSQEAHMRATMIFTSNDIIINLGVIAAGVLVSVLDSNLPDLIIGAIVFLIVSRGAFRILKLGR
jgi:Co/Zn/Cd efflux system component